MATSDWLADGAAVLTVVRAPRPATWRVAAAAPIPAAPATLRRGAPGIGYAVALIAFALQPMLAPAGVVEARHWRAAQAPATVVASSAMGRAGAASSETAAGAQRSERTPRDREQRSLVWSNGRERLEIRYSGEIEFTDDDTDVKSLSPGGYLKVSDGGWFGGRGVEFRADGAGAITRRYRVSIVEKPFEPDGRAWLAGTLPRLVRESGLGAPARVARTLRAHGPAGVLAEITRIEGGHGKRVYFTELFKTPLDPALARRALAQASREIESDYELASLLITSAHFIAADATARSYVDASSTIGSDYEQRRVLTAALKNGSVRPEVLASVLVRAASIESDYELASLLLEIANLYALDATTRGPFFTALESVESDYEHGRVLTALAGRDGLSSETLVAMLRSSAGVGSDYEQAQFLLKVARRHPMAAPLRGAFFSATDQVDSSFERGRVLEAVVRRPDTDAETLAAALRSAASMAGAHERSQVMLAAAASHPIAGAAHRAYLQAADRLPDFEQGQVLRALVRSETRSKN